METFEAVVERLTPYIVRYDDDGQTVSRRKTAAYWLAMFLLGLLLGLLIYFPQGTPEQDNGRTITAEDIDFGDVDRGKNRNVATTKIPSPTPSRDSSVALRNGNGNGGSNGSGSGSNNNNNSGGTTYNPNPQNNVTPTATSTPNPTSNPTTTPNPSPTTNPTGTPTTTPNPSPTPDPGYKIFGLQPWLIATAGSISQTTNTSVTGQNGLVQTILRMDGSMYPIATFGVEFLSDLYWDDLDAGSNGNKAFFHYPGGIEQVPGAADATYYLYVFKGVSNRVGVCPGAASLEEVNRDCEGVFYLNESSANVEIINYEGREYWKIAGLRGTGAFSLLDTKDILTRLQVSTESDHYIQFTTTYEVDSSGDTIILDFVPNQATTNGNADFDFNGIDSEDIDVSDDGGDLTLCTGGNPCSAAAGVWGVDINDTTDIITFTAPTDAGAGEIDAGSIMVIEIGENATSGASGDTQIINPNNVGLYEITIRINNGVDEDFGELEIPIIDDDTTNVVGFIDTFISFDIDTAASDTDCDAAGGVSPCDSHGGATDDAGYVIDLGELNTSNVNDSGDSVFHADGLTGEINSIFFDLSTNADGGATVSVLSLNEALNGPGAATIPSVSGGGEVQITAGSGLYGLNSFGGLVNTAVTGTATVNDDCDGDTGNDYYCSIEDGGSAIELFNTGGNPIDQLRIEWEVGASPDAGDATGTYTDELTFIASATF